MTRGQWITAAIIATFAAIPSGTCSGVFLAALAGGGNATVYASIVVAFVFAFLVAAGSLKRAAEEREIHEYNLRKARE